MGIYLGAMMLDRLLVTTAGGLLWQYVVSRRIAPNRRESVGVKYVVGCFGLFTILFWPIETLLWQSMVCEGTSVSLPEYMGLGPRLPQTAREITYYRNYAVSEAVFPCTESEF